ncbi:TetR/AcrR family transcriptional regulator [Frigoribacterium sp. 2-23]|uniref:TetR/AcrR family transcriptional regulator n=1 Tax=Frigoribacterium sp. 2-23 TaxID=3415006 RepID=UPI003C6F10FB
MSEVKTVSGRHRSETRRRLLVAAAGLFEDTGTIRQSVGDICTRAGFTRGAFYSNFTSVDDLYLALHQEQAASVWHRLWAALDTQLADDTHEPTLEGAVGQLLAALPESREWFSLRSVLLARAAADPVFAEGMLMDDTHAVGELGDRFVALAAVHGRVPVVDATQLAKSVVAAHIGALSQSAVDSDAGRTQRVTVAAVLRGLTVEGAAGR